ncbi:MAG TPA: homoprotocatechuate degradation operon regulator HpaR [Rhodanobacter sp.]|nr:homoprotocatechuate degradation operon regulator HpaR [Rhodanobacter sp.]
MAPTTSKLIHRSLPLLLLQVRERLMRRFRKVLHEHGITEQQWRVVRALVHLGPMEPCQIGKVCHISSPSLAGMLARMDDLGLISRKRMDDDQRRRLVSLTPKSHALVTRMAPQIEAAYERIEREISADCIERCYAVLDEMLLAIPVDDDGE